MSEKDTSRLVRPTPPPLPPRASTQNSLQAQPSIQSPPTPESPPISEPPPPYDSIFTRAASDVRPPLGANDPRTSSTQSLKPVGSLEHPHKRRLLLIYIHGFMGDETSFQSFPAHVHHLVVTLLADTHTVHTKIYPQYRSKKNIEFARDDFSRWLAPHEASTTDVILLGHSMGGLVSAEVALAQVHQGHSMRHEILGTINFDVPFLGMHPGVVKSGLASIFSPATEPSTSSTTRVPAESGAAISPVPPPLPPRRTDTLFNPPQPDPNYNPAFDNDVRLPVRKGWRNAWHFVSKHNEDLFAATKQLVKSHMEFGGAMADYSGLKQRYCRIRALEEQNIDIRTSIMGPGSLPPRVRFVNYYTSSTGRPRQPKSTPTMTQSGVAAGVQPSDINPAVVSVAPEAPVAEVSTVPNEDAVLPESSASPLVLVEHADDDEVSSEYDLEESNDALDDIMDHLDPAPMSDFDEEGASASDQESWADAMEDMDMSEIRSSITLPEAQASPLEPTLTSTSTASTSIEPEDDQIPTTTSAAASTLSLATTTSTLPPLPEPPQKPPTPDFSTLTDKDLRKLAEKDHARALKTWDRLQKDHQRALRDRSKLEQKRQRDLLKQAKRTDRDSEKEARRREQEADVAARKKEKERQGTMEEVFRIQRRETEREWKETLEMKWNAEDGTVTPMASSSHATSVAPTTSTAASESRASLAAVHAESAAKDEGEPKKEKPRKERTFCMLPPKDAAGNRDPAWVKVFMPDVDEVGAHCGLFFETSPAYQQLVGDVGEKVSEWVLEAEDERMARELEEGPD